MSSSILEVNIENIKYNIKEIKNYVGKNVEIMPIVKSNGYGTYINKCKELLNTFNIIGVARIEEAIDLRKNGYEKDIIILYPLNEEEIKQAIEYNFIINSSNFTDIELILNNYPKIRTHLEIDTGMGRTGLIKKNVMKYIKYIKKNPQIQLEGIFTHLSTSSDKFFSKQQISSFEEQIQIFEKNNINIKFKHLVCSGGIYKYHDKLYNMIRIGLLLYGHYANESVKQVLKLKPATKLKTHISFLKVIQPGETVGYNKNFIAKKRTKVATIPFGFADGLIGLETGQAYVVINNQKAKIIGICMDNMMIDVTGIKDLKNNNEVYIWDNETLTVEEVASWISDLCNYEILTSISSRVERRFIYDNN